MPKNYLILFLTTSAVPLLNHGQSTSQTELQFSTSTFEVRGRDQGQGFY